MPSKPHLSAAERLSALTSTRAATLQQIEHARAKDPARQIAQLDADITEAQAAAQAEHEAQRAARLAELRQAEREAGLAVAAALEVLADQVDALRAVLASLLALGAWPAPLAAPNVGEPRGTLHDWRAAQRAAAEHAAQARDPQGQLIAQLKGSLALALERYHDAQGRRGLYAGVDIRQNLAPVTDSLKASIRSVAVDLFSLTGEWPAGLPVERPKPSVVDPVTGQPPVKGTLAYLEMLSRSNP